MTSIPSPLSFPILTAPTFQFAPGDTWPMPVTYRNPNNADGTAGAPIDLSGSVVEGRVILRYQPLANAIVLNVANGGVTVDPTNGLMRFVLTEEQSAAAPPNEQPFGLDFFYPTRLQVRVRDTLGSIETIALFDIDVYDPRSRTAGGFSVSQAGSIIAVGEQGPPGAAGITSINGYTNSIVTLGAHDVGAYTQAEVDAKIAVAVATAMASMQSSADADDDVTLTDAFGQTLGHIAH